jgi:hypothetical protein
LESFDQSLKCLLHHEPEDFIRFGLKDSAAQGNYIPKEKLMTSTLYQEILAEGVEQGVKQGATQAKKETLLQVLTYRLGAVEPTIRERIQALGSAETLTSWHQEALQAVNAKAARKLVEKIKKAPVT